MSSAAVSLHGKIQRIKRSLCGATAVNIVKDGHILSFYEREFNNK
jgi:hypothetical protein